MLYNWMCHLDAELPKLFMKHEILKNESIMPYDKIILRSIWMKTKDSASSHSAISNRNTWDFGAIIISQITHSWFICMVCPHWELKIILAIYCLIENWIRVFRGTLMCFLGSKCFNEKAYKDWTWLWLATQRKAGKESPSPGPVTAVGHQVMLLFQTSVETSGGVASRRNWTTIRGLWGFTSSAPLPDYPQLPISSEYEICGPRCVLQQTRIYPLECHAFPSMTDWSPFNQWVTINTAFLSN